MEPAHNALLNYSLLLLITFCAIVSAAVLINFCRRRMRRTAHGLSGMCHQSGGTVCSSCASRMPRRKSHNTPSASPQQ